MKNLHLIAIAFALVLLTHAAHAASMQYTFTGNGSGGMAGTVFADSWFAIVGNADPANIASCLFGCRYLDFASAGAASIWICAQSASSSSTSRVARPECAP